jgi:hypothetical protein
LDLVISEVIEDNCKEEGRIAALRETAAAAAAAAADVQMTP